MTLTWSIMVKPILQERKGSKIDDVNLYDD